MSIIHHDRSWEGRITAHAKETGPGDLGQSFHAWTIIMLVFLDLVFYSQKNFCNLILICLKFHFGHFPWSVHSLLGETAKKMNDYSSPVGSSSLDSKLKTRVWSYFYTPQYLTQYISYRECPVRICSTKNVRNSYRIAQTIDSET